MLSDHLISALNSFGTENFLEVGEKCKFCYHINTENPYIKRMIGKPAIARSRYWMRYLSPFISADYRGFNIAQGTWGFYETLCAIIRIISRCPDDHISLS